MAKFTIDVQNIDVVDDIEDAIERGVKRGADTVADASIEVAKQRLREAGAIWTGELLESFDIYYATRGSDLVVIIDNDADHAAPIEYGAEYTDRGPPIVALIPWVQTHMDSFSIPDDSQSMEMREPVAGESEDLDVDRINAFDIASEETVQKAFWLQNHIKQHGLDAVGYMNRAQEWVESSGSRTISEYIHKEMAKV